MLRLDYDFFLVKLKYQRLHVFSEREFKLLRLFKLAERQRTQLLFDSSPVIGHE